MSIEQALADYVGATVLALQAHSETVSWWDDPSIPAAAIVLDGYSRQVTWTPATGWRFTHLYPGTAAQRGKALYLNAGPVPAPKAVADRGRTWKPAQPHYQVGDVLGALRTAVPDRDTRRCCAFCGDWWSADPHAEDASCGTCGTHLPRPAREVTR